MKQSDLGLQASRTIVGNCGRGSTLRWAHPLSAGAA